MLQRPNEDIGVIDAQWVEHLALPSLGDQVNIISWASLHSPQTSKKPVAYLLREILHCEYGV